MKRSLQNFGSTHLTIIKRRGLNILDLVIFTTDLLDYAHKAGRLGGVEGARAERVGVKKSSGERSVTAIN